MSSVLIRVSVELKKKLDSLRHQKTVSGMHGYRKKMQYTDLINGLLHDNYFSSDEHIRFLLIRGICNEVCNVPYCHSPADILNHVVEYLDIWLRSVAPSDNEFYDRYKVIFDMLSKELDDINKSVY